MGKDGPGPENKESFIIKNTVKILQVKYYCLYQRRKYMGACVSAHFA